MSKKGYTTDHEGKPSSMRVISFICIGIASVIALLLTWSIYQGQGDNHEIGFYLSLLFLLAGTAPKTMQSYIERKFPFQITKN